MTQADFKKLDNLTTLNLLYAEGLPHIAGAAVVLVKALVKCEPPSDEVRDATMNLVDQLTDLKEKITNMNLTTDEFTELHIS